MLALCTMRDFLAAGRHRVLEGEFQQAAAALARIDSGRHGDCVRIVVDLDVMLVADVQAFQVFAHDHQVDLVEAAAGNQRACGPQVGVQLEFFPQAHVRRAVAAARRRLERALQRQAGASDAVDGPRRQRIARRLDPLQSGDLSIPIEGRPERLQRGERGVDDFGADPVSGDERCGN